MLELLETLRANGFRIYIVSGGGIEFMRALVEDVYGIHRFIGHHPILALGNSDGDHQMLQWTAAGDGLRFLGSVHLTDVEREWAFDCESPVGCLGKALDEAGERGWTVVDMARKWRAAYPWEATS